MGKRFLLLTASIGSGHEKAAGAIADGIKEHFPGARLDTVDFMSWDTSWVNGFMKFCYLEMLAFVPNLYEFMYRFTDGRKKGGFIQKLMAYAMSKSIKGLIRKYDPDVLICTHPFPAQAASHLGETWRKGFLSVAVITDYSVHQMWICPHMDLYFVGCDFMKRQLIADGIRPEIIYVTGIPVAAGFHQPMDKADCREQLQLALDVPVILMMGGGLGLGRMIMALAQLDSMREPLQILVLAGRNNELRQQAQDIAAVSQHRIRVYAYTERVAEMMGAADVLVTKPGALTLTEALARHLPMVLHEPIPGPETDNARYMSGCGAAIWMHAGDNLAFVMDALLRDRETLARMSGAAVKNSRPNTVDEIMSVIQAKCSG